MPMNWPPYGHQTPPQQSGPPYVNANANPNVPAYPPALQNPQAQYPFPGAAVGGQVSSQHYGNHQAQGFRQPGAPQHGPPPQQQAQFAQQYQQAQGAVPRGGPALPNQPFQQQASFIQPQQPPQQVYSTSRSVASTEASQRQISNSPHTSPTNSGGYGQLQHPQYQQQPMMYRDGPAPMYQVPQPQQHFGSASSMGSFGPGREMALQPRQQVSMNADLPFEGSYVTNERKLDEQARKAFDEADIDKSGYLDFKEFLDTLRTLEVNIAYHHALDRFAKMDVDKDGRIRLSEFVNGYLSDQFMIKDHQGPPQQRQTPMQPPAQWPGFPPPAPSQQSQQPYYQQQSHYPPQPR